MEAEEITRRPVSNLQQALQGKLSGFTILDQGGNPGNIDIVMRIKGVTTLSDNDLLVIIDGIEQPLGDLNPSDIESISLLKDAFSTAIYGSRAANGVLLITTKRATRGKLSDSYEGYYALQKANNVPEHMGLEDYMRLQNIAYTNSFGYEKYSEEEISEYVNATDRYKYPLPNEFHDAVLRVGPKYSNRLIVSGGGENIKTMLSLRHKNQQGIIPNTKSNISEIRLNNDFKLFPKINIAADINYRNKKYMTPVKMFKVFQHLLLGSQWATVPKYPDGTYGFSSLGNNPLFYAEGQGTTNYDNHYILANKRGMGNN